MYNLIIGYNKSSINLINTLISKGMVVFLIDSKKSEEIEIKNELLYYYEVDINDMKQVFNKASKGMLLNIFIVTEDDYLTLMIEERLKSLKNVQAIYNSRAVKPLEINLDKNLYFEDFFNGVCEGGA